MEQFTWKKRKVATEMSELSESEKQQWLAYLKEIDAEVLEYDEVDFTKDFFNSFFDEGLVGYNEELWIEEWGWKVDNIEYKLVDIFGFPGDNQAGAIFLNDSSTILAINSDCWIEVGIINQIPIPSEYPLIELFRKNIKAFEEVRGYLNIILRPEMNNLHALAQKKLSDEYKC